MIRCALSSCLALALAACGGGAKVSIGHPQVPAGIAVPAAQTWDGKAPAGGSVTFISGVPGDPSKFIAYEVDPKACTVHRTIEDEVDALGKMVIATITDPMDNAGTVAIIRQPPPPPPDGQGLVFEALRLTNPQGGGSCPSQGAIKPMK